MKVAVDIGLHTLTLTCSTPEDKQLILSAAKKVNDKINTIRQETRTADYERATLKAALLIAIEHEKGDNVPSETPAGKEPEWTPRIEAAITQIDDELRRSEYPTVSQKRTV